jgi:hypothetical protein
MGGGGNNNKLGKCEAPLLPLDNATMKTGFVEKFPNFAIDSERIVPVS